MMNRRGRQGNGQRYTSKFPCFLLNGHILAEIGNDRALIDSGALTSLGLEMTT